MAIVNERGSHADADAITAAVAVQLDAVELNPTRGLVEMTAMVGAKLVKEIAAAMIRPV